MNRERLEKMKIRSSSSDRGKVIPLPCPVIEEDPGIYGLSLRAQPSGEFYGGAVTKKQLATFLWGFLGNEGKGERTPRLFEEEAQRISVRLGILGVLDLEKGIYDYDRENHSLVLRKRIGNLRDTLRPGIKDGEELLNAALIVLLRGKKDAETQGISSYLEAGFLGRQMVLSAGALDLGFVAVKEWDEQGINKGFELEEEERGLFLLGIGPQS